MQRNVRDECFSAFDDRSVAQHKNFTAAIDKTKGKIAFQKNQIPCERSAAVFKCKGKRDLQKTSFLFKVQDDSSLYAECEKTSCKMLLPYDAQCGICAYKVCNMHRDCAAMKVKFNAFGRGKKEIFVEAKAYRRISGRFAFTKDPVHCGKFHRAGKAVHLPEVHPVYKESAWKIG